MEYEYRCWVSLSLSSRPPRWCSRPMGRCALGHVTWDQRKSLLVNDSQKARLRTEKKVLERCFAWSTVQMICLDCILKSCFKNDLNNLFRVLAPNARTRIIFYFQCGFSIASRCFFRWLVTPSYCFCFMYPLFPLFLSFHLQLRSRIIGGV